MHEVKLLLGLTADPLVKPEHYTQFIFGLLIILGIIILYFVVTPPILRRRRGIPKGDQRHVRPGSTSDSNYNEFWGGRP